MKYYLRFGDIPTSGLSNIWLRDEIIGQELGVSVYDAVLMTDGWHVIFPKPMTREVLHTLYDLIAEKRSVYILSGEEIGRGNHVVFQNDDAPAVAGPHTGLVEGQGDMMVGAAFTATDAGKMSVHGGSVTRLGQRARRSGDGF